MVSCSEASERRERGLDVGELVLCDEPTAKGLMGGLPQQLGRQPVLRTVVQRAPRVGCRYCTKPGPIFGWHVGMVQYEIGGHTEATAAPCSRQREMDVGR